MTQVENVKETPGVREALQIAVRYRGIDGSHHKAWVIDQMVRALSGDLYEQLVKAAKDGQDGPNTFSWDTGVPP